MKSYSKHAYFKEKVVVANVLLKMPTPLAVAPLNTDDLVHLIYHCYLWVQILLKSPISTLLFFFFPHSWTQPGILNRSPKLQVFYAKEEEIPLSVHCKFSHQLWFGKRFFVSYLERLKSYWNLQGACAISQSNHSISLMTRTLCYLDQQMCSSPTLPCIYTLLVQCCTQPLGETETFKPTNLVGLHLSVCSFGDVRLTTADRQSF